MNYFRAWKAECLFQEYKELAFAYWSSLPPMINGQLQSRAPVSDQSRRLREKINFAFVVVSQLAHELGYGVVAQTYAPMGGAPPLPVNMLLAVIDPDMGHVVMGRGRVLDTINRLIGVARRERKRAFWRMVNPFVWIVEIPAFCIRLPFLILRTAGLPKSVEKSVWSHVIKILLLLGVLALLTYLGYEKYAEGVLKWLGR